MRISDWSSEVCSSDLLSRYRHSIGGTAMARQKWSQDVTEHSDALDLDEGVFTWKDPRRIAASLKASAEGSRRRKGSPLQSAMSILTFYINRAGRDLDDGQKPVLEEAKEELRNAFGKV